MECVDCNIEMNKRNFVNRTVYYCPKCYSYNISELECDHNWVFILFTLENGHSQLRRYCTRCHEREGKIYKQSEHDLSKIAVGENDNYNRFIEEHRNSDQDEFTLFISKLRQSQEEYMYSEYTKYIRSDNFKLLRTKIIERDGGICQICGAKGNNVHHLTYTHFRKEYLFELVLLCENCHIGEYHSIKAIQGKKANELLIPLKSAL